MIVIVIYQKKIYILVIIMFNKYYQYSNLILMIYLNKLILDN